MQAEGNLRKGTDGTVRGKMLEKKREKQKSKGKAKGTVTSTVQRAHPVVLFN